MELFDLYAKNLVIDIGCATVKAGFCGEELPKLVAESVASRETCTQLLPSTFTSKKVGVGSAPYFFQSFDRLVDRGRLTRPGSFELIIAHISETMKVKNFEEISMLVTRPSNASQRQNVHIAQHSFERLEANGLALVNQAVLPLAAEGCTTGCVIELGDGLTQTHALFRGHKIAAANKFSPLGGRDVDEALRQLLQSRGQVFSAASEFTLLRKMKEELCSVSSRNASKAQQSARVFTCPDGEEVSLGPEATAPPQVLFNGGTSGGPPLPQLIASMVEGLDIEVVAPVLSQVLVSGELRSLPNLGVRMSEEIAAVLPPDLSAHVVVPPAERHHLVWRGGAKLAANADFSKSFIRRAEWAEFGESILHRKRV